MRMPRLPPVAIDTLLGVAVAATLTAVISAGHGGRTDPDTFAYLWAAALGTIMLARRRYPGIVLGISVLGLFAYYTAGYPAVGVAVPVAAALFSAAEFGRLAWAVTAALGVLTASVFFRLADGQSFAFVVGYDLAGHALLVGAAIALGDGVRSRRRLAGQAREIAALTADQARRDIEAREHAERVAVARDLHDSLGHAVTVMSLHADVAREAVERQDDRGASEALTVIKQAAGTTMADLRHTVRTLRSRSRPARTTASLANLDDAIPPGLDVSTEIDLPRPAPSTVDTAAFRIVQESLTNVVKHAHATRAHVAVRCSGGELLVSVTDDGPGAAILGDGHGIAGMRERVRALGGRFTAGPEDGGFAVRAALPIEEGR